MLSKILFLFHPLFTTDWHLHACSGSYSIYKRDLGSADSAKNVDASETTSNDAFQLDSATVDAAPSSCKNDDECNDGLDCTTDSCLADTATSNKCKSTLKPDFCLINNQCYPAGALSPENFLFICDPNFSTSSWNLATWSATTLAGSNDGYVDGPGNTALFDNPRGLIVDNDGKIFIADKNNHVIRQYYNGQVTTFAGNATQGYADGPANTAQFNQPNDIVFDNSGGILVADTGNHRIRLIKNGQVSTVAGNGSTLIKEGAYLSAGIGSPTYLAIDSLGNIYLSITWHILLLANGQVTTFAGTGTKGYLDGAALSAQFGRAEDIAVDKTGRVLIADSENHVIRSVLNGQVTTYAGIGGSSGQIDGALLSAKFTYPRSLAIDKDNRIYVVEWHDGLLRKDVRLIQNDQVYTLNSKFFPIDSFLLGSPMHIAVNNIGHLFISDGNSDVTQSWYSFLRMIGF